jgi:hypothetical protein
MIVSLNSRHRSHAGALPKDHADGAQAKTKKESRANIARRLSRSRIPKASAPRLHQTNRLAPKSKTPCPISQSSAHAQRVSLCRFLRSQPRRIGLGYRRTGRDPDPPSFTSTTNFTAADTNRESLFAPRPAAIHVGKGNAPEKGQTQGCWGLTESEIVALRRSWRQIFLRKTGTGKKRRKWASRKNWFHMKYATKKVSAL